MPGIEYEQIATSYEFEDRAAFFIAEIEKLARRYSAADIEIVNFTIQQINDLEKKINIVQANGSKNPAVLRKLRIREYSFETESASENSVHITVCSRTSPPLSRFEKRADELAKKFRGVKNKDKTEVRDNEDFDDGEENTPRFEATLVYDFKNDIKFSHQNGKGHKS